MVFDTLSNCEYAPATRLRLSSTIQPTLQRVGDSLDEATVMLSVNWLVTGEYFRLTGKATENSWSGITGNWDSLNSLPGIPGNFKSFWFVKIFCTKFWKSTAKFASFASVIICITKAHKCSSHLHTLQGQPDRPTYPNAEQWFSLRTVSHRCLTLCWCLIFLSRVSVMMTRDIDIAILPVCPSV